MTGFELGRRQAVLGMGATLMTSAARQTMAADGDFTARLATLQRDGKLPGLHAIVATRGGRLLFEHYETGEDEVLGRPLGQVKFGPDVLHDLRSVTKSVVGIVYGIALADGKVPPPQARLYDQFPEYPDLAQQPGRDRITMAHVLSMTMGIEWDELTVPYGVDLRNSEIAMEAASDRYRYILACPIVGEPGVKWVYNGGATALLGRLIAKGTGEKLPDYARRVLFDPLGLGATEWSVGRDGESRAASGLRMRPVDLARIGGVMLSKGTWQETPIVPAAWIQQLTTPVVTIEPGRRYGWHWYLGEMASHRVVAAVGWGGQRLFLLPDVELVVATHFGNYRRPGLEQGQIANRVVTDLVLPALA
jgi:CubicO group peptidase (beta-lactamase class C family)